MKAQQIKSGAEESRLFGIKKGDIRTLAKKIKTNHPLGLYLWQTQNYDARLLAILIMKPALLTGALRADAGCLAPENFIR